ncbi:uncharacterized protein JN550_003533 [Neoarthrinium moseri]|uniref:uncharacterized protein n=1 Tax=Neoarthrinium moseri TaxID=1658444 RepID=UPI001FDDC8D8|nr:uncharacterized protein JN550_003533 [Neoarthrinium moseri]KAI1873280.1 hypothetical protein JN550_003533 [Neoarthrinium moseri]
MSGPVASFSKGDAQVPPIIPPRPPSSLPATPVVALEFASISMHMGDRLRLLGFDSAVHDLIRVVIKQHWSKGLRRERDYHGSHEFHFYGRPWYSHAIHPIESRRLMNRILEALFNCGWIMSLNTNVTTKVLDVDTLIFHHQSPQPEPHDWMCIGFTSGDCLRFIDAPEDVVQATINDFQTDGTLKTDVPRPWSGSHEVKVARYPWFAHGSQAVMCRLIVLRLLGVLKRHGWSVYASVNQRKQKGSLTHHEGNSDTWHCCRRKGWVSGQASASTF